ncbi:MAG: DUF1343 domain-containing protein [Muribaculaceae bacterium]|nr:DUF1343 domain-containing protein [Muribaculaceae bacterium]
MNKLRIISLLAAILTICGTIAAEVHPGIETLRKSGFEALKGKRVGLLTNATGVDTQLRSTIDILHEAPDVELVALFAPEHGVRGDIMAGQTVTSSVDPATGIKVYSLYGATKKPTAEMLKNIDVMVYDIQDNGSRSYTFISSMGLAMDACAAAGKEFVVLDRPNPLGGNKVEGNVPTKANLSFLAKFPIPYVYGLTAGELARMIVGEGWLTSPKPLNLTVIPMEGWHRNMLYSDTGMPWVPTSPQIPEAQTCIFYPATGIVGELNYVSIGVGYTLPFQTIAAPWIQSYRLAEKLNARNIPGVRFRPISYKPWFGQFARQNLQGVQIYVVDYEAAPLTLIQFYVLEELARLYPDHKVSATANPKKLATIDIVVADKELRPAFFRNHKVDDILPMWTRGTEEFRTLKAKYHLYDYE